MRLQIATFMRKYVVLFFLNIKSVTCMGKYANFLFYKCD